jgi:hypothetical protein
MLWWVRFGFLGWGLGLEQGICSVGWCLELKRLLQFSGSGFEDVFSMMLLGFRLGLDETFLWKMWVIVLQHLYRCYVEYRLNTRVSI